MRRSAQTLGALAVFTLLASTCASVGNGLEAWMRVPGAEFVEGAMPEESGGPETLSVKLSTNTFTPGQRNKPLEGTLDVAATGVAIGIEGDEGYWLLAAQPPSAVEPDFPSFAVTLELAPDAPSEELTLVVRATDEEGRFGPAQTAVLSPLLAEAPDAPLVISLSWDTQADLDLHVVDPNGIEIHKGNPSSFQLPLPGEPPPEPGEVEKAGFLDFDSNAQCVIDGRNREEVVWKVERPGGRYTVRVDTYSLCDALEANWRVTAVAEGELVAEARGLSTAQDASLPHGRGAGVLALEVEVP